LLANVDGVKNAVLVWGDAVGPTLYYGAGAGADPTASAVVADLVDVARTLTADPNHRVPHLAVVPDQVTDLPILPMDEIETGYYLRLTVLDQPGVLANIARTLADFGINIEAMIQKEASDGTLHLPIVLLTHPMREATMNSAIAALESLTEVCAPIVRLRVESLAS
jgi:homoserine dehydrogenase